MSTIKLYERIVETNMLLTAFNRDVLGKKRFVDLECGHVAITGNYTRVRCGRCEEMLRRSVETGDEDYEAFRRGEVQDQMAWEDDPCRFPNEPHDLSGKPMLGSFQSSNAVSLT